MWENKLIKPEKDYFCKKLTAKKTKKKNKMTSRIQARLYCALFGKKKTNLTEHDVLKSNNNHAGKEREVYPTENQYGERCFRISLLIFHRGLGRHGRSVPVTQTLAHDTRTLHSLKRFPRSMLKRAAVILQF